MKKNGKKLFFLNMSLEEDLIKGETVACYLNIGILVFGVIMNTISISAFAHKELRKRKFNWYLLVLTIVELIFCLIVLTDYMFSVFGERIFLHAFNKITNILIDFTIHTSDSYITALTLLLTLDRLYAIKRPMQIKMFITNLHAKKMMTISLLIVFLLKASSHVFCSLKIGGHLYVIYCSIGSPLVFNLIPLFIILVLNIWLVENIICYIRKNKRQSIISTQIARKSFTEILTEDGRRRGRVSIIIHLQSFRKISKTQKSHYVLILVHSIYSIIAATPYYSLNPYISLHEFNFLSKINFNIKNVIQAQIVASILFNSNHCFNFFIYFCFYSDFRVILKKFVWADRSQKFSTHNQIRVNHIKNSI
jgi:hypothetical protein